ncbi:cytochrome P450 [Peziza echinospora]|nr:cytochrome P450 [Peziza echinospora]
MAVIQIQHTVFAALVILAVYVVKFVRSAAAQRAFMKGKPGPPHSPLLGHLPIFAALFKRIPTDIHPHAYGYYLQKHYGLGRIFYLDNWPFSAPQLLILDADIAQQVTHVHSLDKHPATEQHVFAVTGREGILTAEGEVWRVWRQLLNPGFSAGNVGRLVPEIVEATRALVGVLRGVAEERERRRGVGEGEGEGDPVVRLEDIMTRYTLDIIGRVVLDVDLKAQTTSAPLVTAFRSQLEWIPNVREVNPFKKLNPLRPIVYWWNNRIMDNWIEDKLRKRFQGKVVDGTVELGEKKHVIDLALKTYVEGGKVSGVSKEGRKGKDGGNVPVVGGWDEMDKVFKKRALVNIRTLIFAGHDTSSSHLCYTLYLLSKTPHALKRTIEEHNALLPSPDLTPDFISNNPSILKSLHYTNAALKEALRLYPSASTARIGERGFFITDPTTGEKWDTEGCLVWVVHHGIHRQEVYYESETRTDPLTGLKVPKHPALEFWPERWLSELPAGKFEPNPAVGANGSYRPFEKGPRNCIGQELAMLETLVAVAMVVRSFTFDVCYTDPGWRGKLWGFDDKGRGEGEEGVWRRMPERRDPGDAVVSHERTVDGPAGEKGEKEWAYQVLMATAKPKEGMPCVVGFRK